jgi:cobalamin 5'-phosphate synthase/cobalamin synthase
MPGASLRAGAGAVSFLTRVPVGRYVDVDGLDVARGAAVFPLVGAGVGALTAGVALLAAHALPAFVAAALGVAAAALVTGAMHLDALADAADALGGRGRDEALAIMRDSRIGTFGAVALALDLLLKVGCLATLLDRGHVVAGLVAAGALSRATSPPLAAVLPYPRVEGGPGSVLTGRLSVAAAAVAAALGASISLLAWWPSGVWLVVAAAGVAATLGLWYRRWLGGATGDCLGAATELCETVVLVVAAALA